MNEQGNHNVATDVTAAPKKTEVVSLVLGIIGVVFALLLPIVAYPLGIVGLVFAVKRKATHKSMAGMVLCIITLVAALINSIAGVILMAPYL